MDIDNLTKDEINHLEELSDKARKGIPIGFNEAILVIEYQESLETQGRRWERFLKYLLWDEAEWWEFWRIQSGILGGSIMAALIVLICITIDKFC